jgi:hypothetical protein
VIFQIIDGLDRGKVAEEVVVNIDGISSGKFLLNQQQPRGALQLKLQKAGNHYYQIISRTLVQNQYGQQVLIGGWGQGSVTIHNDCSFAILSKYYNQIFGSVVNRRPGIMLSILSPVFGAYASNPL